MNNTDFGLLVIEDSQDDIRFLQDALQRVNLDYRMVHLDDGAEAIKFIRGEGHYSNTIHPHLVLLDLGLPKASGIDVLRALRNNEHFRHVPVIIMSSLPHRFNRVPLEELGAEMYWTKPTDAEGFDDLAESIRSIAAGFCADSSAG